MSINQSNMIFTIFRKTKLSRMRFVVNEHNQFANEGREKVHSDWFTIFQHTIG